MTSELFTRIEMAPRDPILGVTEAFVADTNPRKVNLGVGVYYDDNGKVPLLECVKRAEAQLVAATLPRAYLPIDGLASYDKAVQALVFGADSDLIAAKRVVTVQALPKNQGFEKGDEQRECREGQQADGDRGDLDRYEEGEPMKRQNGARKG